jgi:hypothetical protein
MKVVQGIYAYKKFRIVMSNKSPTKVPAYRNKLWISGENIYTIKRMDSKYILTAIKMIEEKKGKQFNSIEGVANLQDLKDELNYRKRLTDAMFGWMHVDKLFNKRQYEPCRFFPDTKPSNFTTKGIRSDYKKESRPISLTV